MNYLQKIERNRIVAQNLEGESQLVILQHVRWAVQLASRLDKLDYDQKQIAINNIINVLDNDYQALGFELNPEEKDFESENKRNLA